MDEKDFDATVFLKGINAIIIDDDELTVKLIKDTLEVFGLKDITCVYNGNDAVEAIKSRKFNIIITDWKVDNFDGNDFIRDLREDLYATNRYTPVILITGKGTLDDVKKARDAGITEFILKPFSVKQLKDKVIEVIENPRNFIISREYAGPDRRRKKTDVKKDRRKKSEDENW